ncbi:hypothetical protein RHSIM_Rhsim07G0162000 [Rhododendron simsii]|uniref:RNase H type-1 domain-containing protein n=1 Tax=Rhododendron simsii TaxID=118357 RepID=A0A834GNL1_RHOSS|nr:hypothetical protein RHSIM_Rhsim07G0162000 [Rhododendron simsii]
MEWTHPPPNAHLSRYVLGTKRPEREWMLFLGDAWRMTVDGALNINGAGVGIVLVSSSGNVHESIVSTGYRATNNEAEYEALITGLQLALRLDVDSVHVFSDSQLIVGHLNDDYQAKDQRMNAYVSHVLALFKQFGRVEVEWIAREHNAHADTLAGLASGLMGRLGLRDRMAMAEPKTIEGDTWHNGKPREYGSMQDFHMAHMVHSSINSLNVDPEAYPTLLETIQSLCKGYRSFNECSSNLCRSIKLSAIPGIHIPLQVDDSACRGAGSDQGNSNPEDRAERAELEPRPAPLHHPVDLRTCPKYGEKRLTERRGYHSPVAYWTWTHAVQQLLWRWSRGLHGRIPGEVPNEPLPSLLPADYNLAPIEVAMNIWRILYSAIRLAESNNLSFTLGDLMLTYMVSRNPKYDKYYLTTRQYFDHLVDRLYDTKKWGNVLVKVSGNFKWEPINRLLDYHFPTRTGSAVERPYRIPRARRFPGARDKPDCSAPNKGLTLYHLQVALFDCLALVCQPRCSDPPWLRTNAQNLVTEKTKKKWLPERKEQPEPIPTDQSKQQNQPPVDVLPTGLAEDDLANPSEPLVLFVSGFECSDGHVITIGNSLEESPLLAMTFLKGLALPKDMENLPTGKAKNMAELCLFLAKCASKVFGDMDVLLETKRSLRGDLQAKRKEAEQLADQIEALEAKVAEVEIVQSLVIKAFKEGELKGIKDTHKSSFLGRYQVGLDYAEVPEVDHRREPPVVPPVQLPESLLPAEQPNLTTNTQPNPTDMDEA